MSEYKLKKGKIGDTVTAAYKKVEQGFENTFLQKDDSSPSGYTLKTGKVGEAVTMAYKSVEEQVVGGYKKVENAFVNTFLEKAEPEDPEQEN